MNAATLKRQKGQIVTSARRTRDPRAPKKNVAASKTQPKPTSQQYLKVADIATFLSLASGVLALVFALESHLKIAGGLLIASLIFDGLDGRIARWMGQGSEFGMYLDSLTDAVVFGAVPAAIALALLPVTPILVAAATVFIAAGIYRLARFQFTKLNGEFQGMPITMNGIFVGIILIFVPASAYAIVFPAYFIASAVAMVSTVRIKKP